jgi:glycosyltransferase involved in cell wall biosynthesis
MRSGSDPRVSVLVIGYGPTLLLGECLAALTEQARGRTDVEVVVVAHATHQASPLAPLQDRFPDLKWIVPPPSFNVARMRGTAIAHSRGEFVVLLEGDCIPEPGWLVRLAGLEPQGAVGGPVEPGGFRQLHDWAAYFCEFAPFMAPLLRAPDRLPGTNVMYRRDLLPEATLLRSEGFYESFYHDTLWRSGGLDGDSALIVRHERRWNAKQLLATRFHHGRGYAGLRTAGRSLAARFPFLMLALLLPPVLSYRVVAEVVRRRRLVGRLLASLGWIVVLSTSWSLGELVGYAAGPGDSLDRWR